MVCVNCFLFLLLTFLGSMIFVSMFWGSTEREREKRMNELDFVCVFTLFRLPLHVSQKIKKKGGYHYMKEDYEVHVGHS